MTLLQDIITLANAFHSKNGYPPTTVHLTIEQLAQIVAEHNDIPIRVYGMTIQYSDAFAVSGTQPPYLFDGHHAIEPKSSITVMDVG